MGLLEGRFAICKLDRMEAIDWEDDFVFVSHTDADILLLCREAYIPENSIQTDVGWRLLRLDHRMGKEASKMPGMADVFAGEPVRIALVPAIGADYLLVRENQMRLTVASLHGNAGRTPVS